MLWGTKLPRDIVVGYYFAVQISDAISRWAGWPLAHLEFGVSVNPFPTWGGADCVHCITACPHRHLCPYNSILYSQCLCNLGCMTLPGDAIRNPPDGKLANPTSVQCNKNLDEVAFHIFRYSVWRNDGKTKHFELH